MVRSVKIIKLNKYKDIFVPANQNLGNHEIIFDTKNSQNFSIYFDLGDNFSEIFLYASSDLENFIIYNIFTVINKKLITINNFNFRYLKIKITRGNIDIKILISTIH
ncbi:MAG: hypothetical protein QXX78_06860 [Nitrososphaerota archaeon]